MNIIYAMHFPVSEYHFYYEKRKAFSGCKKRRSAEYTRTTFKLYLNKYTVEQNRRGNQDWTIQRHWAHNKGRRQKKIKNKSITGGDPR
jgi:hypothetical protein